MTPESLQTTETGPERTSLGAKLLNLFVSPALVFDEVMLAPPTLVNWLVPTVLVCLSGLAVLDLTTSPERTAATIRQLMDAQTITQDQASALTMHWKSVSSAALCLGAFLGTFWSAFVLWFIGRFFLKCRFGFIKALEVSGLAATILVLGTIVTALLVSAVGDASARPSVSLLLFKLPPDNPIRAAFGVLDCFHLWTTGVLAIGLSRLTGVSAKEAAFWVFGYWVGARIALILLA
jgi:Yip1-like protein